MDRDFKIRTGEGLTDYDYKSLKWVKPTGFNDSKDVSDDIVSFMVKTNDLISETFDLIDASDIIAGMFNGDGDDKTIKVMKTIRLYRERLWMMRWESWYVRTIH